MCAAEHVLFIIFFRCFFYCVWFKGCSCLWSNYLIYSNCLPIKLWRVFIIINVGANFYFCGCFQWSPQCADLYIFLALYMADTLVFTFVEWWKHSNQFDGCMRIYRLNFQVCLTYLMNRKWTAEFGFWNIHELFCSRCWCCCAINKLDLGLGWHYNQLKNMTDIQWVLNLCLLWNLK